MKRYSDIVKDDERQIDEKIFRSERYTEWKDIQWDWSAKTFSFLNLHALLRSGSTDRDMNKFKTMCEDDVDLPELRWN